MTGVMSSIQEMDFTLERQTFRLAQQTYPSWMQNNPALIGMSKSLSTNLNHLHLLRALEALTGEDHQSTDLAEAIDAHFWTGSSYSSFKTTELHPTPTHQQDLLATSSCHPGSWNAS